MKKLLIAASAAALMGCATMTPDESPAARFDRDLAALMEQAQAGQISEKQLAERAAVNARVYFPNDYQFHALRDYKIALAERLERGEISRAEFDYEWSSRRAALLAERQQLGRQLAAQESAANAAATATFLNNVGHSFRRAAPPAPIICTSMPLGYSISTTCQ